MHPKPQEPSAPEHVPKDIAGNFKEADYSVRHEKWESAGMMLRKVLERSDTSIAALKDALPQLAAASTITAVLPLITALETEIENRHPDAYAYGSQSTLNVLNALTTCSSTPE